MKQKFGLIFASIFIGCLPVTAANAVGVFSGDFSGGTQGTLFNGQLLTIGYEFQVSSDISVTELGWYAPNIDVGLSEAHLVGIWNVSGGDPLAQTTILSGTGSTLDTGFRYESLGSSLTLFAGNNYVIGGVAGTLDPYVGKVSLSSIVSNDPSVSYLEPRAILSADPFQFPGVPGSSEDNAGYFGPNFKVAPVPVPAAVWLFGSGLLGLIGIARKRKAA
jgi:hypothetical protein